MFRIDSLDEPRLVTWAAKGRNLDALSAITLPNGEHIGQAFSVSHRQPDGSLLAWTLTDPTVTIADGIIPFFIDWGDSPHPASAAPAGLRLEGLSLEHPDPASVKPLLERLGLAVPIHAGGEPALQAFLETPQGDVILR